MKSIIYKLFYIFILLLFAISCAEDNQSELVIFLTPAGALVETNTNEHVFIKVEARATNGEINKFNITIKDEFNGITSLIDSSLLNKTINYEFDYIVPEYQSSTEALLTFTVIDDIGNQVQAAKRIIINKGSSLLSESSGHVIYSSLSGRPNAFNLINLTQAYSSSLLDVEIDFMDNSIDSICGNKLSRVWISRNGLNFVQYNGFNYAMANSAMISNAYESGIKLTKATNIQDNDVYLIGRSNEAIGAIQVISVTDIDSTLNDKYVFNLKIKDSYFE